MVRSRFAYLAGAFVLSAALWAGIVSAAVAVGAYAREAIAVAFPAPSPRDRIEPAPSPVRVMGLPSLRAFRDSVLSRMGDGRERSPLSVAFVT